MFESASLSFSNNVVVMDAYDITVPDTGTHRGPVLSTGSTRKRYVTDEDSKLSDTEEEFTDVEDLTRCQRSDLLNLALTSTLPHNSSVYVVAGENLTG